MTNLSHQFEEDCQMKPILFLDNYNLAENKIY